jgi:hypothetical protein
MTEVKFERWMGSMLGSAVLTCGLLFVFAGSAGAYAQYHPGDSASVGDGCYQCHGWDNDANPAWVATSELGFRNGGFDSRGPLHDLHVSQITGNCDLCHINTGDVPYTYTSGEVDGQGCRGCHGTDPGGAANFDWGAGLRLHHANAGAPADLDFLVCANCHSDPAPQPEDTVPVYYLRADVNAMDPCNADGTEDWGGLFGDPPSTPDGFGLDNDGDLLYDAADLIDCPEPGETLMLGVGIGILLLAGRLRGMRR